VDTTRNSNISGDRRVRRTRATLARALLELAETQDLSRISVSDVAERAGVSRTAFYDHYRDVHALAEDACTAMIDDLIASIPAPGPGSANLMQEGTQSLAAFFANLAQHAGLYRSLLGPQGSARVADHIRRRITVAIHDHLPVATTGNVPEDAGDGPGHSGDVSEYTGEGPEHTGNVSEHTGSPLDSPQDIIAAFTAGALFGVAADWLQRGCPQTPDQIAALTYPLLASLHLADAGTPA
jgi:AcrR family transcriptional regulator